MEEDEGGGNESNARKFGFSCFCRLLIILSSTFDSSKLEIFLAIAIVISMYNLARFTFCHMKKNKCGVHCTEMLLYNIDSHIAPHINKNKLECNFKYFIYFSLIKILNYY